MSVAESALERSLSLVREQGLQAVDVKSTDAYRSALFNHVDFLSFYLQERKRFARTVGAANLTLSAFFGYESSVLFKIARSTEDLIRKAVGSGDARFVEITVHGLVQFLGTTLDFDALPVFRKALDLVRVCLAVAVNVDNPPKRIRAIDLLLSGLESFASYNLVARHLDDAEQRLERLPEYGKDLVKVLHFVFKEAVDRGDSALFSTVLDALQSMLRERTGDCRMDLLVLNTRLQHLQLTPAERSLLEARQFRLQGEVDFYDATNNVREDLTYYSAGWVVRQYSDKKLPAAKAQVMLSKVLPYFGDFVILTKRYLVFLAEDSHDFGWEFSEAPGGGFARPGNWLTDLYVIAAMRIVRGAPNQREQDEIYHFLQQKVIRSDLLESIRAEIERIGGTIQAGIDTWQALVPELGEEGVAAEREPGRRSGRFEALAGFWQRLFERRQQDEERNLIEAEIAAEMLAQFAAELRKAWFEHSVFRSMAKAFGFFEDHTQEPEVPTEIQRFGLVPRLLEDKIWFTADRPFASQSIAENLGRGLGELESKFALDALTSALELRSADGPSPAKAILDGFIDSIPRDSPGEYVLLSVRGFEYAADLYASDELQSVRGLENREGLQVRTKYRGIPILEVYGAGPGGDARGFCVRVGDLGSWRQYWARNPGEEIAIQLEALSEPRAEQLLRENPGLGQGADAVLRLRKKVLIDAWERFSYTPGNKPIGVGIVLPPTR